jgi:hypothetical protein
MSDALHRGAVVAPPARRVALRLSEFLVRWSAVACTVSTVIAFAGPWHWYADLFSHFRVQYFITLAIAAPVLWFRRMWILATVAGIACMANAWVILPHLGKTTLHHPPPPGTPPMCSSFRS